MEPATSLTSPVQRSDEPDPRTSLRHVLVTEPSTESQSQDFATPAKPMSSLVKSEEHEDGPEDTPASSAGAAKDKAEVPLYTATTTTTRRNANGSVSSVYSGNKIRHLKKEDGVPLWRKDIQYEFLKLVFDDDKPVFHKVSDGTFGHTFADIYLDAMAKSSKCSKILKDKLLTEREPAKNMAMVCLLVNVGRMNTTLNFFPEMRAQLRTYHSIPSLQAHQDPNAYKQLQDAPRLKSILKGATEDIEQPSTLEDIKAHPIPRTNPVNLIFVLAQYAPKISELHFDVPRDFFDLVMKSGLSSRSRATAFLWLMWWYLESDFSTEAALNNPYGPGRHGQKQPGKDDPTNGMPLKCPQFEHLTEEQAALENVDTPEEIAFGEEKRHERIQILASDMAPVVTGPKRGGTKKGFNNNLVFSVASDDGGASPARDLQSPAPSQGHVGPSKNQRTKQSSQQSKPPSTDYQSDSDNTRRSASPPIIQGPGTSAKATPNMPQSLRTLLNDDLPPTPPSAVVSVSKGPGRGNWSRREKVAMPTSMARSARNVDLADGASPSVSVASGATPVAAISGPHGFYLPLNGSEPTHKRSRPQTAHQIAVERYRKEKVNHLLDRGMRVKYKLAKRQRQREGAFVRAWKRVRTVPDGYDSEEEIEWAIAAKEQEPHSLADVKGWTGLYPVSWEEEDFGEEAAAYARALKKVSRRLERWEGGFAPAKRKRKDEREADTTWTADMEGLDPEEAPEEDAVDARKLDMKARRGGALDDYEAAEGDEELDEMDRELLGEVDADASEDEAYDEDTIMAESAGA